MRRLWRLMLIGAVAVAAFALALGRFSEAAEKGCTQRVRPDDAYSVAWNTDPRTDLSSYRITVLRDGEPVSGARVCLNAYMVGMSAMAVTDVGREVEPGVYEMRLTFEMGQTWAGQVLISEPGSGRLVGVPLRFPVEDKWGMSPAAP